MKNLLISFVLISCFLGSLFAVSCEGAQYDAFLQSLQEKAKKAEEQEKREAKARKISHERKVTSIVEASNKKTGNKKILASLKSAGGIAAFHYRIEEAFGSIEGAVAQSSSYRSLKCFF